MRTPSGLKIKDLLVGTGAIAQRGRTVTLEWRGWLNRGEGFGGGSETCRIGDRRIIAGLELGVIGMRVGGVRRLRVGPHLGYRDRKVHGMPSNAVLNFEVRLLDLLVEAS